MASKLPAVKGAAYTFRAVLFAQSGNQIKTSPTIAAGDFQVSTDGGAFANLATIPAESPASSGQILVTLSTSEMNGDEIAVRAIDASGDEWHSQAWTIMTAAQTFDTTDGVADTILDDTNELQGNQSAWATADVSGLATSVEVGALNNIAAADVWSALGDTEKNAIADAILSRGMDNVEDTASALSLAELVLAAFESAIDGTTWTIYKSDHSTTFNSRLVMVDADADPIIEVT